MVIVYSKYLKPEYWDCNLDFWLENWKGEGPSACVWFVPGTIEEIEAWYAEAELVNGDVLE